MPTQFTLAELPSGVVVRRAWRNDEGAAVPLQRVVAIPACNEDSRMERCLASLAAQDATKPFGVLVFVNGTTDATLRRAVAFGRRHTLRLRIIDAELPPDRRDAGAARCAAIHMAMAMLPPADGAVFTTDADSEVPSDWLRVYGALLSSSCDVVAGTTTIAPDDADDIPRSLRHREQAERDYAACLDAIEHRLDPVSHDPWPRHYQASGANLALSRRSLSRLLHLPWPAAGEDRRLVACAQTLGLRVRHDTTCKVLTSGRMFGRARGGMADTMRRRILDPESPCDERLEAVEHAVFRARMRRVARDIHGGLSMAAAHVAALATHLGLAEHVLVNAMQASCFEAAWADIERTAPRLARQALRPGQLMHQCALAEALLARLGLPLESEPSITVSHS